jgi:hypothetical protein
VLKHCDPRSGMDFRRWGHTSRRRTAGTTTIGPELWVCGSGSATSGPPTARELGKRETGCGGARTASTGYVVTWEKKALRFYSHGRSMTAER